MENFMTVEQLIAKLQKCDPKAIVAKTTDNFEQGNNDVPATGVYAFKGNIVEQIFRDAFDGENYFSKVIMHSFNEKNKKVLNFVKIS